MQTAAVERVVQNSGAMATADFGISVTHAAHIMGILRSTLYSKKALAVLREYGTNAWDEHRQCGKGTVPIQVTLPSAFKPTLKIRDFGRGLSEYDVLHIYTQYGESTKRDTNDAAGMLGIGCKAGFAYADQFTVTSWHGGTKSVYCAVLDKSNKGRMDKLLEEPCGDETGIEIQIAVRSLDVGEFHKEARGLFRYFNPQPKINIALSDLPKGMTQGFVSEEPTNEWIAVMGCIPYRLDLNQVKDKLVEAGYWDALAHLSGGIYLPIGTVEFSASREELQYTEKTNEVLATQFLALVQEYIDDALTAINKPDVSAWDRRMKATFMHHVLKFPMPAEYKAWADQGVPLWPHPGPKPTTFNLVNASMDQVIRINVRQDTRILIVDNQQPLNGWHVTNSADVIAVPREGFTYEQVETEIQALCVKAHLDGIPISPLTTRGWWSAPYKANGRRQYPPNQKHKDRTFTLRPHWTDTVPRSKQWDSATPPEGEHIYVILFEFAPSGTTLNNMQDDKRVADEFGVPWPVIYGYKTTLSKPLEPKDIENGIPYQTWRDTAFQALLTDAVKENLRDLAWAKLFDNMGYKTDKTGHRIPFNLRDMASRLAYSLGDKHQVTRYFAKSIEASRETARLSSNRITLVHKIDALVGQKTNKRSPTKEWLLRLLTAYPMFWVSVNDASDLAYNLAVHYDNIIKYIKDRDEDNGGSIESPEA